MDYIKIDFETYYDKDYSLRKMTPVEYVLDPRFEVIMMSVKRPGHEPFWLEGEKIKIFFSLLNPKTTVLISHNALFDMCIVAWHYNFEPALFSCTMSIARAMLGHALRSVSLESVAAYLGIGHKGHAVQQMTGLRAADIKAAGLWESYVTYCLSDSVLCEGVWDELVVRRGFPASELLVLDMVLRAALRPSFVLDGTALAVHHANIQQDKANLLNVAGLATGADGKRVVMSNPEFAKLLSSLGVDPPMKTSPTTGRETYAFAKSDQAFTDLEEHPDPMVQAVVAARLGLKSTIEETRCERMKKISQLAWPAEYCRRRMLQPFASLMPMPLRYAGAHTGRLSGDWKLNVQNFPARAKINHLKCALTAPPGHTVLNIDSSQIEARIVAWLAGELDLLEQFRQKLDPYKIFAAKVFNIDVSQVTKEQRFLGKTSILGLGFGLGWLKFKSQVRIKSLEAVKLSGQGQEIHLTDAESVGIVNTYRGTFLGVPALWKALNNAINILAGSGGVFSIGPCRFERGKVSLPNGLYLHYHNLRRTEDGWLYDHAGKPRRLYGGALLENIVQALARIIVMDAALRIKKRVAGLNLALQVHDALVYVVPNEIVTYVGSVMEEEMSRPVAWALDLPLAAELHKGPNYGDCH